LVQIFSEPVQNKFFPPLVVGSGSRKAKKTTKIEKSEEIPCFQGWVFSFEDSKGNT
jgi:hypothetical protein